MHNTRLKHKPSKLIYALNSDKELVNVDDVPTGNECGCICPACNEPLMAKNQGQKRIHHFAHQSGTECDFAYESMLHLLAKDKIRNAFLSNDKFVINFEYKSYCSNAKQCPFIKYRNCYSSEFKQFNLKEFYDSCEQEISYDNIRRRSDLKIYSSTYPQRAPIYIEFCVTHASDEAKLHSNNKIIEIIINEEADITNLIDNGFIEDKPSNLYGEEQFKSKVSFYGFKNEDYNNQNISRNIEFVRYILYQSGKTQCHKDVSHCKEYRKKSPTSLLEMRFHTPVSFDIYDYAKYVGYQKFGIHNCNVCKNYVEKYTGDGRICRLYKRLGIQPYENLDTSRAKTCQYFYVDKDDMERTLSNGSPVPFDTL